MRLNVKKLDKNPKKTEAIPKSYFYVYFAFSRRQQPQNQTQVIPWSAWPLASDKNFNQASLYENDLFIHQTT